MNEMTHTDKAPLIEPEVLAIANAYLKFGSIETVASQLKIAPHLVSDALARREVKAYVDSVFLHQGYMNRDTIAETLTEIIQSKLEEAKESEFYTKKDLADLLKLAHDIRIAELKIADKGPQSQTNIQINDSNVFGEGNYGKLMEKLLGD